VYSTSDTVQKPKTDKQILHKNRKNKFRKINPEKKFQAHSGAKYRLLLLRVTGPNRAEFPAQKSVTGRSACRSIF
jgi:hypothetical protein